jgi:hypothetical protein
MIITAKQLALLHHTLGLRPDRRISSRNHFMAGPGHHDQADLEALEVVGLMVRRAAPAFCKASDVLFRATDAGQEVALELLPLPPKLSRYQQFMHDDFGHSFAEWLGIEVPKFETRNYFGPDEMVRMSSSRATGEWKATKKDAKASYKAALAALRHRVQVSA